MENFKNKTIYQIYTKSFMDSDADGLGDLKGIISRLDYLQFLGVDYLWLTPFYKSPMNDNGYDVADYCSVDPRFGTMEDIGRLIREAGLRNIGLMFDMVFNHTSTEHEWFRKALQGDPEYMDYYIFREGAPDAPPTNWESKFGGSAWEYVPHLERWYLHLFDVTQADLNWRNPKVREELKKVILFWKEKGVKGFRFDVVNLISKPEVYEDDYEGDGRRFYTDGHSIHRFLKELTADTGIGDMITVGEMSSTSLDNCIRYSNPEEKELSMCFNFHHLKVDYKDGNKWALTKPDFMSLKKLMKDWQEGMAELGGWNAVFWCNHDQPRIVSRFGDDTVYWKESAKMLASCIHLLRGTPYIYQGEELGMTNADYSSIDCYADVESLNYFRILRSGGRSGEEALAILGARSRDNGRTPMQWSDGPNAGFTEGSPWLYPPANYERVNVEGERADPDSILMYYRRLIALRRQYEVIADGSIRFVYMEHPDLFSYIRENETHELIVLNNFHDREIPFPDSEKYSGLYLLLSNYRDRLEIAGNDSLRPYESVVLLKDKRVPSAGP